VLKNINAIAYIVVLSFLMVAGPVQAADNKVMEQPTSPIQISEFVSDFGGRDNESVQFEARYENVSNRTVIAIKFGFIAYDLFNESLGGVAGIDINRDGLEVGEDDSGLWSTRARGVARAHETGIAYVQKVRFSDGELWIADRAELEERLNVLVPGGGSSLLGNDEQ